MAFLKASGNPNPLSSCSVSLPTEATKGRNGTVNVNSELAKEQLVSNSSSGYMTLSRTEIPEIPDIPSPLLRPPAIDALSASSASEAQVYVPSSSAFDATSETGVHRDHFSGEGSRKTSESLNGLIRNQVGKQVDTLFADAVKDFQGHLISKASEVDQLRVDLQNMEHKEKNLFTSFTSQKGGNPVQSTFSRTQYGSGTGVGNVRAVSSGFSDPPFQSAGLRETNAQMDDLKRKLKMTTELCAKQDAYYRGVVSDLENQIKESIAGRDHVLAIRESESSGQLRLIHQLEAGLRNQQQVIDTKDESLSSMQTNIKQLEEDLAAHKSFLDKVRRIVSEEDRKRFRSSLVTSALESTATVRHIGDALVELIQKCFFDDDKEKKTLRSSLDQVEDEFKRSRELSEIKHEKVQEEHKARMSKLEEEHNQALELTANRAALVKKELESLQQETAKMKETHKCIVSTMEDKTRNLELELEKAGKTNYETTVTLEAKCKELEYSVRDLKSDLQRAKDEEQSLYSRLSQEQATVLTLNEKVRNTEKLRHEAEEKADDLSKKLTSLKEKYNVETQTLHESIVEKEKLIKEIREEAIRLRGCEVEKAINEEKEKSNARLDGILDQLAKSNQSISTLKEELLSKGIEASKRQDEMVKLKEDLDVGIRERSFIREEKVHLSGELEKRQIEILNLEKQVVELSNSLELKGKSLEEAQNLVKKLQTQLSERENVLARFETQGTNLAEILERNSQTGDSLQREREQLIRTLEERISEVEEMKSHREILAKKLKSKDKKVKELEEEKSSIINSLKIKHEELDAIMEDRSNIMAELKLRQIEVSKLKDENTSLSSLVEGKDGKREKEITKLLSRLKGSEQDLALTRKLLKTKGAMSGKAVQVAESMQQEVTAKRGELDALQNRIHWLTESLNNASKDARYYERKSSELSEKVNQLTMNRDQLEDELGTARELCSDLKKKLNHMEQALEKAALKHADSQGIIEKMEQEMARLKLKHSLEVKELERTSKAFPARADATSLIEFLTKFNSGFRWPPLTIQPNYSSVMMTSKQPPTLLPPTQAQQPDVVELDTGQQEVSAQSLKKNDFSAKKNEEVTDDLRLLLNEVRSLISSFQAHVSQISTPVTTPGLMFAAQGASAPERGPSKHEPTCPNEGDLEKGQVSLAPAENKEQGKEHPKVRHGKHAKERHSRSKDVAMKRSADIESDSSQSTDVNSRVSNNYELEDTNECFELPLHSSSPKRENAASVVSSQTPDSVHSPLTLSDDSYGSDVASLLVDQSTFTGNTVVARDLLNAPLSYRPGSASSSAPSSQRGSNKMSYAVPTKTKCRRPVPQRLQRGQDDERNRDLFGAEDWTTHRYQQEQQRNDDWLPNGKTSSDSEPVYRRAEMILQSLAQTGAQLTKKNREIEHLLKEQDKKIRKCRKNEHNIHALLS
ncbi:coiled-coil domain-containing protein 158-like isoform X4 [Acropora muricata]|uniref:coiled-coil domain-containing protein 158-like isoform X4 n=1 Tax=Acropora muricata TaxID=159855 RepID=UPI0034E497D2